MKKVLLLVMVFLGTQIAMAQQAKKDSYELNGDKIETIKYHDNGAIAQEGSYTTQGILDGQWMSYDANGKLTAIANYSNGKKVGTWTFYSGDYKKEVRYENEKIAEVRTWELTDTRVVSN